MRSTKTTKEKLIERINALKELPRTDNVQSILNRLEQELSDLGDHSFERECYSFSMEEAFFNFVYSLIETAMKYNCSLCIEEFVGYITIYTDCDVITLTMNDGYVSEIRYDGTHLILDEDMQRKITKLMKE